MFEELRGLPPKPEKTYTKKQKGCFKISYGFLIILIAVIVGSIFAFRGCDVSMLKNLENLAKELSVEVDESQITPNKIIESDFVDFEQIINSSVTSTKGLAFFDENHKMLVENMYAEDIIFNNNITLSEKTFACFCADILEANLITVFDKKLTKDVATIIQVSLNTENLTTQVEIILKIDPNQIFQDYPAYHKKYGLANTFYLKSSFSFNNATNEILQADLHVNQLTDTSNTLLLQILSGTIGANKSKLEEFCQKPAKSFVDSLDEFKQKYDALITFAGHSITAITV